MVDVAALTVAPPPGFDLAFEEKVGNAALEAAYFGPFAATVFG